jgi:2-polyprenyl-6-methoxyphenol hydroxylase-like FAD-dependent oxidoreductase
MNAPRLPVENVLIVGGGIAGLGAAIALGRRGVQTTVVERADGAIGASIGLGERAVYALEELGILDRAIARGRAIMKEDVPPYAAFNAQGERLPGSVPDHGDDWTLPIEIRIYRPILAELMREAAREHGAEILMGHSYRTVEQVGDRIVAELTIGERREFDLLMAADGVHSELRSRFFPAAGEPVYTGFMSFRAMLPDGEDDWPSGRHIVRGTGVQTALLRDNTYYVALPRHMEQRRIEQDEARAIMRETLQEYHPSELFDELTERITDDVNVIIGPFEWIFVEPPWHTGRVVLIGDAAHATAPTIGMAGGMALEDTVVLAQELDRADELDQGLTAYAQRRCPRAKLVVETSAMLMDTHRERRPPQEEWAIRLNALYQLIQPY